ncbi:MAG: fatty acid--CoA ligase family protein [Verrucomicrobiota bacterium]
MSWIEQHFSVFGSRVAAYEGERCWQYDDLLIEIQSLKEVFGAQISSAAACLAIEEASVVRTLAAIIAVLDLRQIALPISTALPESERLKQKQIAGASWTFRSGALSQVEPTNAVPARLLDELTQRAHAGLVIFSSGTSGEPKGMLHDLDELLQRYKRVKPRNDRTIQLLMPDHIGGLDAAFRTLLSGSTIIVPSERSPDAVAQAVEKHAATVLPATPTFLNLLQLSGVSKTYDFSSLEIVAYGAEPMPKPLLLSLSELLPKVDFQQKFGTSETGPVRIKDRGDQSLSFVISDADIESKIVDSELWLRTPSRILGYLNAEESSLKSDGWYRTGDLVESEADGSIRIVGKATQMINVGGQKVHPAEVEAVVGELESVLFCRVTGEVDPILGERIVCSLVLGENSSDIRTWKRRVRSHCRGRLADWKIPTVLYLDDKIWINARLKYTRTHREI